MAIPGEAPDPIEVRGKIRIGEKALTSKGKEYPKSVDYFVSDDAEIKALGAKPQELLITFPYSTAEENFSTGLEWWKGQLLACYTKDGGDNPVALRVHKMRTKDGELSLVDADDKIVSEEIVGQGRVRIACRGNDCPHFEQNANKKECRPMARLVFFLKDGRVDKALQFETKSWNTIRGIRRVMVAAERRGPFAGRVFRLTVKFERKGDSTFPVVSLEEVENVVVNNDKDVALADALIELRKAVDAEDVDAVRKGLAGCLDVIRPGWRDDEDVVARIREAGVFPAARKTLERYEA